MNTQQLTKEVTVLADSQYCKLELDFWTNFEKKILKKSNIEIIDREKYSWDKIVESRKNEDGIVSYGLVFTRTSSPGYCIWIYTNSYCKSLRYGIGRFENGTKGIWQWLGGIHLEKSQSDVLIKYLDFDRILQDKTRWRDVQNFVIRRVKKEASIFGFFQD
jgi:hypothetical protein